MKKNIFLLFILLPLSIIKAQPYTVSNDEAIMVARNWIRMNYPQRDSSVLTQYILRDSTGKPLLYEITTDSTTILLSGNKACKPVLGYCGKNIQPMLLMYTQKQLPCGLLSIIDGYVAQIEDGYQSTSSRSDNEEDWRELLNGDYVPARPVTAVGPLLKSLWSQQYPNYGDYADAYNYLAPPGANGECEHCLAGCVAVAMAQVMYYWNYPVVAIGTINQYDWCNMAPYLNTASSDYEQKRDAIAFLIRDCGRRLEMSYGCDGSGAQTFRIRDILVNQLSYNGNAIYLKRRDYESQWMQLLKDEIDSGRPVIYRGDGIGSHAFVCDGYDNNGYFHFNWGWGGMLSNNYNGFFSINQITVDTLDFTRNQAAIFNIQPASIQDYCDITLYLEDFYTANIPYLLFHSPMEITPQTMTTLISAPATSPLSWRTIPTGTTATYQAHEEIVLRDGFSVEEGADFTAQIVPCPNCENRGEGVVEEEAGNTDANLHGVDTEEALNARPSFPVPLTDLYPNPTSGELTVTAEGEVQDIVIYNAQGKPVGGWNMLSMASGRITLDVSPLPAGTYLLTVRTTDGKTRTGKFVKQ